MREIINLELHARPYVRFHGPAHVLHLSFLHDHLELISGDTGVKELLTALGLRATYQAERHGIYAGDVPGVGHLVFTRARHTSYTSFTFYLYGLKEAYQPYEPFDFDLMTLLPPGWLDTRRGDLLNAVRLSVMTEDGAPPSFDRIADYFDRNVLTANQVMGGAGTVWSDFRLAKDGFGRMLLVVREMSRHELGRTVQRLLNVEDYYHLVLAPLSWARELQPSLAEAENRLNEAMKAISRAEEMPDKRLRLGELMALAVEVEHDLALLNVRLSPAFSYCALLKTSFDELREVKVQGLLPMSVFVLRRVSPAVRTYTSLQDRLEAMSRHVARAADLLRTSIELNLSEQNQRLLTRLDERAKIQLRLQETVEGLSVIAISYYAVGLIGYSLKGVHALGWHFNPDATLAGLLPVVVGTVWLGGQALRRQHRLSKQRVGGSNPTSSRPIHQEASPSNSR
jgi:uncharacterized membrane-anchored protein